MQYNCYGNKLYILTLYLNAGPHIFCGCVDKPTQGGNVMNTKGNLALAVLAGISIGAVKLACL
jgi:hypothetical protein